jgi:hypothetical protein
LRSFAFFTLNFLSPDTAFDCFLLLWFIDTP